MGTNRVLSFCDMFNISFNFPPPGVVLKECAFYQRGVEDYAGGSFSSFINATDYPDGVPLAMIALIGEVKAKGSYTHLPAYSPTYLPAYSPTHLPTYPPVRLPTYPPTHLTYPLTHLTCQPLHLPTCSPAHLLTYSPTAVV